MFRNIPIFAIAMTAGLAAVLLSGFRPLDTQVESASIGVDADAWFI